MPLVELCPDMLPALWPVAELWPLIEPELLPDCMSGVVLEDGEVVVDEGLVEDWLLEDWPLMLELLLLEGDVVVLDWLLLEGELCVAWLLLLLPAGELEVVSCCATAQAAESNRTEVKTILFRMR